MTISLSKQGGSFRTRMQQFSPGMSNAARGDQNVIFDKILARDKAGLDFFWLKDKRLADLDNLSDPDELALESIENLEAVLEGFREIVERSD